MADEQGGSILAERGRRLASEREDLIVQGVDPAALPIPLHPDPAWITPEVSAEAVRQFQLKEYDTHDISVCSSCATATPGTPHHGPCPISGRPHCTCDRCY